MDSNEFDQFIPQEGERGAPAPAAENEFDQFIPKAEVEPTGAQDGGLKDIQEKAIAALPDHMQETARSALSAVAPTWSHNPASYSPYKPADPQNMPNDAINPVGTDAQMVGAAALAGAGSVGARMLARASADMPPGPIPSIPKVNMSQMPTQQAPSFGAQMAQNTGGGAMPIRPPSLPGGTLPTLPTMAAPAAGGAIRKIAGAMGSGLGHTAAEHLPFPLNMGAHMGLKVLGL